MPTEEMQIARQNGAVSRREIARVEDQSQFANMLDTSRFEHMQRVSTLFSQSTMIPEHYRGNVGNCFIALQMSLRLGVDPFMFMQKSYIVHGKPGIEAQLAIALINSSGIFEDALDFEINGDDPDNPGDPSYMVRAYAVRKSTGKRVNGPWINWNLVKSEGWFDKPGSKWKTMPEQMFMYRAASFFGRLHCPERLMGMMTAEELFDTGPGRPGHVEAVAISGKGADAVRAAIEAEGSASPKPAANSAEANATAIPPATPSDQTPRPKKPGRPKSESIVPPATDPIDPPRVSEDDVRRPEDVAEEFSQNVKIPELVRWLMSLPAKVRATAMTVAQVQTIIQPPATDDDIRNVAFNAKIQELEGRA